MSLVTEQIEDGRRLGERLAQDGFAVPAACWGGEDDSGQWHLYLVSPVVEAEGIQKAYLRVHAVIREMQKTGFSMDPFDVKVVGPSELLAEAILKAQRHHPSRPPIWCNGVTFG